MRSSKATVLSSAARIQRSSFDVQALVKNPAAVRNRYRDMIIDPPSLEEIMLFYTKGDQK